MERGRILRPHPRHLRQGRPRQNPSMAPTHRSRRQPGTEPPAVQWPALWSVCFCWWDWPVGSRLWWWPDGRIWSWRRCAMPGRGSSPRPPVAWGPRELAVFRTAITIAIGVRWLPIQSTTGKNLTRTRENTPAFPLLNSPCHSIIRF